MLPCSPEGGAWGREGTPLSLGSSLGVSWSSSGRLGLHHRGGTEADFGHHDASVRSGPPTTSASACLYVHINTTRFGQGIRNHPAFNYRSTGTWETAEKIISLACFAADKHSALAIPEWASGNVNRHIFGMPRSLFWMVSAFYMSQNHVCLEWFYTKTCANTDNTDMFKYLYRCHILYVVFDIQDTRFASLNSVL